MLRDPCRRSAGRARALRTSSATRSATALLLARRARHGCELEEERERSRMRTACPRPGILFGAAAGDRDVLLLEEVLEHRAPGVRPLEVDAVTRSLHERIASCRQARQPSPGAPPATVWLSAPPTTSVGHLNRTPFAPSSRTRPCPRRLDRAVDVEPRPPPVRSLVEQFPPARRRKPGFLHECPRRRGGPNGTGSARSQSRIALMPSGFAEASASTTTSARTSSGCRAATRYAFSPPIEWPTRTTGASRAARWQPPRPRRTRRARTAPACGSLRPVTTLIERVARGRLGGAK